MASEGEVFGGWRRDDADRFFAEVSELVQRLQPVPTQAIFRSTIAGLLVGREVYGDFAFLERDNCFEAMDEARDGLAYSLMEALRDVDRDMHPDVRAEKRLELMAAACHFVIADWHLRRAATKEREDG